MKRILLIIFLTLFIIFAGFIGITFYFSDLGSNETMQSRMLTAFVYYFFCGLVVTWLSFPKRRIPYLLMWGVAMVALLSFSQAVKEGFRSLWQIVSMILIPFLGIYVSQILLPQIKKRHFPKK